MDSIAWGGTTQDATYKGSAGGGLSIYTELHISPTMNYKFWEGLIQVTGGAPQSTLV
jgi:hypothetical protein